MHDQRVDDGTRDAPAADSALLTKLSPVQHEALAVCREQSMESSAFGPYQSA